MNRISNELKCKVTTGVAWVMCPVCGHGKLLKLTGQTRAAGMVSHGCNWQREPRKTRQKTHENGPQNPGHCTRWAG